MEIKRVQNLSKEAFVNDFLLKNQPLIVTDAMYQWDLQQFSPTSLERSFGDADVQIYNDLFDLQTIDTLGTYLRSNFNKSSPKTHGQQYIRWYTQLKDMDFFWADEIFASLQNAWTHPYFLPDNNLAVPYAPAEKKAPITQNRYPYKGLFISGAGGRTRLHKDPFNSNAILCQFYGEKRLKLFSPDQSEYLMNNGEFVDIQKPDEKKFPNFRKAVCSYEDTLATGEIVLFPAGWFHDVVSVSDSISITWNFVHNAEADALCSHIDQHPNDDQLEVLRFFLREQIGDNPENGSIIDFLKRQ